MQSVGKDGDEHDAFSAQLLLPHRMRVRATLMDLDGDELADLSGRLIDGQVNIDATAETSRSASVTLDDPDHALHLDSDAPVEGGVFLDRMIGLDYGVYVDSLGKWITVPVFRGPVTGMERDGDSLALSCLGKEHLAKGHAWRPMTLRRGMDTVEAIRTILRDRAGETDFAFPKKGGKLPDPVSLGRLTQPWALAQQLAASIDRQLYYDGAGVLRLRKAPSGQVWAFQDGNGGSVLTPPKITYDLSSVSNLVWVKGKKPSKDKPRVSYVAVAQRSHPLSPVKLGRTIRRDGKNVVIPRYFVTELDNDKIRSRKDARRRGEAELRKLLREGLDLDFDALPAPHLDPLDPVRLKTADADLSFDLLKASIPLTHAGVMAVGTNRRVTPSPKVRTRR